MAGAGPQCLCTATRQGAATILGALGQLPHDADMNMRLGGALVSCLDDSSLPVLVEAVNAIIDVYSKDELHAMFVALRFPELLPQSLKHITAKVRCCCAPLSARPATLPARNTSLHSLSASASLAKPLALSFFS